MSIKTWDIGSYGLREGASGRRGPKASLGRVKGVLSSIIRRRVVVV